MKAQAQKAATDGKIADSAKEEIQKYLEKEQTKAKQQLEQLKAAEQEVLEFRRGKSSKTEQEVITQVNNAVSESTKIIRILEKKTEVIVDFLGNETFSKSEIGALFSSGEYRLNAEHIAVGKKLFTPIIEKLFTFAEKYKDSFEALRGEIIVTGYSDAMPVEKTSPLYNDLSQRLLNENGVTQPSSTDLNQKLSELRAKAIKELLENIIAQMQGTSVAITPSRTVRGLSIKVTVLGRGEELPKGLVANEALKNDRRRRVVTFYWVVLPTL